MNHRVVVVVVRIKTIVRRISQPFGAPLVPLPPSSREMKRTNTGWMNGERERERERVESVKCSKEIGEDERTTMLERYVCPVE